MKSLPIIVISLLMILSVQIPESGGGATVQTWAEHDVVYNETLIIGLNETLVWEGISVRCAGGLKIEGTLIARNSTLDLHSEGLKNDGHLTLVNSSLLIGPEGINNTAYLNATDLDGDPGTVGDASRIVHIPTSPSYGLGIIYGTRNPMSSVNINRSFIKGMGLSWGRMDLDDVLMENCTISRPDWGSEIRRSVMRGNGTDTAIECFYSTPMSDITVSDYQRGVVLKGPNIYDRLNISNCSIGIDAVSNGTTIRYSRLINNTVQVLSSSNISLIGVDVRKGRLEFSTTSTTTIYDSIFRELETMKGSSNGAVTDSTFEGCDIGLERPFNSIISRNRFIGNLEAVKEGVGCKVFHNSFIDNVRVVMGPALSTWYNDSLEEGNHYDRYGGKDDGSNGRIAGDGIGDTDLPFLGRDLYPLLQDRYWDMPEIPELKIRYEIGSDRVDLSWRSGGKRYIVQRSTSPDFSTRLVSWSSVDTSLSVFNNENTTLFFRIRTFNDTGSRGWSVPEYVHVDQRPLPPRNIWLEPVPEGKAIQIRWEWEGEDLYRALIYYSTGSSEYNSVGVYFPGSSAVITNLINGMEYSFYIVTIDHSGLNSERSVTVRGVPKDTFPPPPPRDIVARAKDNETIVIEWSPPLTQDILEYILYRRERSSDEFMEVARLARSVLFYEDRGLSDNTTYEYAMASVDDDGPVSELSPPVRNTTSHNNQRPIFTGSELIIYLMEDSGPHQSRILEGFSDPDGDALSFKVVEYFPFKATIADGLLWLVPEPDQAGEGYVEILVSDGEGYALFLIGILIEPVEDPPRDVRIINPTNGSILLPGTPVTLEASGYDPDVANGDVMNVTWTSDVDGLLHTNAQSIMRAVRELSPGRHRISLTVEDKAGNSVEDSVIVMLSLWGWGDMPWRVSFSDPERRMDPEAPLLELIIENDSPLVLKFNIQGELEGMPLPGERNVMIGPRSNGRVVLESMPGQKLDGEVLVELEIEAATLNETYAGSMEISDSYRVVSGNDASSPGKGVIIAIVLLSVLALIGVGSYLLYTFISRTDRKGD
ncbi:MAG: hypothetical protein JW939_01940 [Candidatus Thermoplasmatota archaeon]|nr:hypothetical protein [Candidatus Thermoplasmatota archaeon]